MHCHALFRAEKLPPRAVQESKAVANVRVSVKAVRNVMGAARYVVKSTRNPKKFPELPPLGRARLVFVSQDFLTAPFCVLEEQIRDERAERRVLP